VSFSNSYEEIPELHFKIIDDGVFPCRVGYARTNVIGSRTSFIISSVPFAYTEIYVFRGNPFQTHSLEQVTIQHNHLNKKIITQNKTVSVNII